MAEQYQSLPHSKWNCKYHVVFGTKGPGFKSRVALQVESMA
jgi:hypothetical protein